jgi:osmotically-inducible protein OsmY
MRSRSLAAAVALLALVGCSESRQEKFEKAMRAVEAARTSLDAAQHDYAKSESEYAKARDAAAAAEAALGTARGKVEAATAKLESARSEVAKWADDASVSRLLQQRLLAEPTLEKAAVSARVEHGVALLEGSVPDAKASGRAAVIARETPGVLEVQSHITVSTPSQAAPAPAAAAAAPPAPVGAETAPAAAPEAPH